MNFSKDGKEMKKSTEFPSVVIKEITFNNGNKIKFNKDDIILLVGANNVGKVGR